MTNVASESNLCSVLMAGTCGGLHAQKTGWQSGMHSSSMHGLPMHLMQALNAGTVVLITVLPYV